MSAWFCPAVLGLGLGPLVHARLAAAKIVMTWADSGGGHRWSEPPDPTWRGGSVASVSGRYCSARNTQRSAGMAAVGPWCPRSRSPCQRSGSVRGSAAVTGAARAPIRAAPPPAGAPSPLVAVVRRAKSSDIDLAHPQHRLHDPACLVSVRVAQELVQDGRDDLPRQTVLVLKPAAPPRLPAAGELVPQVVDLVLAHGGDEQRDGLSERELRTSVEGLDLETVEGERHRHRAPRQTRPAVAVSRDPQDPGVREYRDIEVGSLLRLIVEP